MQERKNVDVVKDAYRAFNENNFDVLLECLDENVKWFAIGPPHLIPMAGTRYGPEQVEQYFALLGDNEELRSLKPLEFIAEEDHVVAIGEQEHLVTATGSATRSPWVHVFTLRHGRISEFRAFYDTASVIEALDTAYLAKRRKKPPADLSRRAIF
jgi:uncharacterized protein